MSEKAFTITDAGGIEFAMTDANGDTRKYRLEHDSQGRLVIGHQPAGSDTWEELVPEQASGSIPTN